MKPKVMVLYGQGINCDNETKRAFELAGAEGEKVLMSQLIAGERTMEDYDILAFPGGFSYGDDIAAGRVMGIEFKYRLREQMEEFVEAGKPIIGICNGFQIMVNLGLLPGLDGPGYDAALMANDSGMFEDRWAHLGLDQDSPCIFTRGIDSLYLPVRHMEGKFHAGRETLKYLQDKRTITARYTGPDGEANPGYPWNPNGSLDDIAGVCDPTGRMFGLMPHPEACTEIHHYPTWTRDKAGAEDAVERSLQIFRNAVEYVRG